MLQEYFGHGTEQTVTGGKIGIEIETDFIDCFTGKPISDEVNRQIFATAALDPLDRCVIQRELGRQKIELAVGPYAGIEELLSAAQVGLAWLYKIAAQFGAMPVYGAEFAPSEQLLMVMDQRDAIWLTVDGRSALEELCRCSSVQFTVDVNPADAISIINELWRRKIHLHDYDANRRHWRQYIRKAHYGYDSLRFAGPSYFVDLADYANQLNQQPVVMHQGRPVRLEAEATDNLDIDLFLRSVWWNYRLRRYGNSLAVEIRPFARRSDETIAELWQLLEPVFTPYQKRVASPLSLVGSH